MEHLCYTEIPNIHYPKIFPSALRMKLRKQKKLKKNGDELLADYKVDIIVALAKTLCADPGFSDDDCIQVMRHFGIG